jgi:hypothetical protein
MGGSTGVVLAVGGITIGNELLGAALKKQVWSAGSVNWRVIPATLGLALALDGLEKIAPAFAVGLAWLSLVTVLIVPFGNHPTPIDNALRVLGYGPATPARSTVTAV